MSFMSFFTKREGVKDNSQGARAQAPTASCETPKNRPHKQNDGRHHANDNSNTESDNWLWLKRDAPLERRTDAPSSSENELSPPSLDM